MHAVDTVSLQQRPFPPYLCGPRTYSVIDTSTGEESDIVQLKTDDQHIFIEVRKDCRESSIGVHDLMVIISLEMYPSITAVQKEFQVSLLDLVEMTHIPDLEYVAGAPPLLIPYQQWNIIPDPYHNYFVTY